MSDSNVKQEQKEMGFFDHIGELRIRLIYSLLGLAVASAIAGYYIDFIMDQMLLKPAMIAKITLQNLKVFGQPVLYFKVIIMVGIILSFPFTAYQIWKFVEPALYSNEKGWARRITFFTTLCFICGVAFSYFVMIPSMLAFSSGFGSSNIKNIVDINEYWSFLTLMILAAGFFFELPMISFVLSKIGLLTPRFLRKYRRHSIVIILLLSAIITPSPDPVNQMIVAIPIYILYEISIIVSKLSLKKTIEES